MKLQTKMMLLFSVLFTAGFLMLVVFTTSAISRTNQRMVDSFSTQSFEFKAQEVGAWLGQRITELRMIARNEALRDGKIEAAIPYVSRLNENVGTQYGNEWGTFAIGYRDGIGWVSEDQYIDVSERSYFAEAMEGEQEYVLSSPVISKTDQADISLICYPLRDKDDRVFGFLNAAISLEKLSEIVSEIEFYGGSSWIMDPEGNIYASVLRDRDTGVSDGVPGGMGMKTGGGAEMFGELLTELEKAEPGEVMELGQGVRTVFYTPIPYAGHWYLCTAVERSLLMADTRLLLVHLAAIFLVVMILLFFCCMLLSRSITRPIHNLMEAMREVEHGKWDVSVKRNGKDELAQLYHSFEEMVKRIHGLVLKTAEDEREKQAAELRVLQAQINPHFLYNTLDTLQYMADENEDQEMVTMIRSLSTFFRISLSRGRDLIPLEKEVEHVKSYLSIQKIRFQEMLHYDFEVKAEGSFYVLKLILQPLAENAIQHGIRPKLVPGHIHIRIWQQEEQLLLEVSDDGVGMSRERLESLQKELEAGVPRESYGMINVNNRLKLLYGEKAGLTLLSEEGKGTSVCIHLPAREEDHV